VTTQLVGVPAWTSADEWTKFDSQRSAPLLLAAGQQVLLEAAHCNQWGAGIAQVGVIAPSDKPR
jgi:predicted NAD-dependent protein-ADP-ribosyltransferase YbiA (DUF1768 family)